MKSPDKSQLVDLVLDGLKKMHPAERLGELITIENNFLTVANRRYDLSKHSGIYLIGFGKAASQMGEAVKKVLGDKLGGGMILTPNPGENRSDERVAYLPANHPKPGKETLESTQKLLSFLDDLPERAIVINVVSGGTSAMLELPADGISLEEIQRCFDLILSSGANISEMNTMRKQLSQVKGGRLQHHLKNKILIDVMMSDVPGDNPADIGSGPTVVDTSTRTGGVKLMRDYAIYEKLPDSVKTYLESDKPDTKPQLPILNEEDHHIVMAGTSQVLAEKVAELAKDRYGWECTVISPAYSGQLSEVTNQQIERTKEEIDKEKSEKKRTVKLLIFHGESYVQVTGDGKGGRNQELALRAVEWLDGKDNISLLSMGTDGIDGPTDAAGAFVNGATAKAFRDKKVDWVSHLENNDAYHAFEHINSLIKTGATGQNFMDIQLWLVG